jgi:cation:H+ antiporter
LICLGILLLVAGGILLRGAVGLATPLRLTPAIIGLWCARAIGAGVGRSAIATWRGTADIAVANVVGSNISTSASSWVLPLIRPLTIWATRSLDTRHGVGDTHVRRGGRDRLVSGWTTLFLATYVGFTAYMVSLVRQRMSVGECRSLEAKSEAGRNRQPSTRAWVASPCSAQASFCSAAARRRRSPARWHCRGTRHDRARDRPDHVAAGTGLPEVVTSLVSSIRGRDDVAIGNVIG